MAETSEENVHEKDEAQKPIVKTVTFKGRKIRVRTPSPEQVMVWQRVLNQISDAGNNVTGEEALSMMNRARKIVDSILVDDRDKEWLDDQMLDGTMFFDDLGDLMVKSVKLLSKDAQQNGQGQSAARRKKAKGKR